MFLYIESVMPVSSKNDNKFQYRSGILYVGGSGPNNYTRVQDAIDDADDGDTIFIFEGIYHESNIMINKSIELIGENEDNTTIDGDESYKHDVIKITSDNVKISNLIIRESGFQGAGIVIISKDNEIINCTFINNGYFGGICPTQTSENNTIKNSSFINNWWAMHIRGSKNDNILNCYFQENTFYICWANNISISNSIFCNRGIQADESCNNLVVENCNFSSCIRGIEIYERGGGNQIKNCNFENIRDYGIYIGDDQTDLEISGCNFTGCGNDGIIFWTYMEDCKISDCIFIDNFYSGICFFGGFKYNVISGCHFESNRHGIELYTSNRFNRIENNNFINNQIDIQTDPNGSSFRWMLNFYKNNYWDKYDGKDWNGDGFGEKPWRVYGFINWDFRPRINAYPFLT